MFITIFNLQITTQTIVQSYYVIHNFVLLLQIQVGTLLFAKSVDRILE